MNTIFCKFISFWKLRRLPQNFEISWLFPDIFQFFANIPDLNQTSLTFPSPGKFFIFQTFFPDHGNPEYLSKKKISIQWKPKAENNFVMIQNDRQFQTHKAMHSSSMEDIKCYGHSAVIMDEEQLIKEHRSNYQHG